MSESDSSKTELRWRIPHRPPMHWIDAVRVVEGCAEATRMIAADHPFVRNGRLLRTALIEMLCQAAACAAAAREPGRVLEGRLVAARDLVFSGDAQVGELVTLVVHEPRSFGALAQCAAEAQSGGRLLARGRLTFQIGPAA